MQAYPQVSNTFYNKKCKNRKHAPENCQVAVHEFHLAARVHDGPDQRLVRTCSGTSAMYQMMSHFSWANRLEMNPFNHFQKGRVVRSSDSEPARHQISNSPLAECDMRPFKVCLDVCINLPLAPTK